MSRSGRSRSSSLLSNTSTESDSYISRTQLWEEDEKEPQETASYLEEQETSTAPEEDEDPFADAAPDISCERAEIG
ncbi:hypothetical protein KEM55_001209, partial [Ascosphaera atra]